MSKDLFETGLGKKPNTVEGAGTKKSEPATPASAATNVPNTEVNRGDDLLAKAANTKPESSTANDIHASSTDKGTSPKSASSKEEPAGSQDPEWSTESALKEVKKLREENKAYRLKYAEKLDEIKSDADRRMEQKEQEMLALIDSKKELDRIKAEQEDKKRDLAEKLAHREARVAEMQVLMEAREREFKGKINQMDSIVKQYEADKAAESQIHQARLNEELGKIPEQYKDYAGLIVKGAGDPREGLVALIEAKMKGMFDDKTVVVNHSVPGAHDGARASKERLDEAVRAEREKMNPQQKIRTALAQVNSGTPNSAFRTK